MHIKKLLPFLLLVSMSAHATKVSDTLNVFACEPEWASLANALGGDKLDIFTATTAKQDPHHIQARPKLIAKARKADLLLCTGADLEVGWLPVLLRKAGNGKIMPGKDGHFMAAEQVRLEDVPVELDRSKGDIHAYGNPHIHLDPGRMLMIANVLSKRLVSLDSSNKGIYELNMTSFSQEWSEASSRWLSATEELRGKEIVIHHNSWVYLQSWLELKTVATLEPVPGIPASSKHLASLLAQMKESPAYMIMHADYQDDRAANWLADKTFIPVVSLPFSPDSKETLINWFDRIIDKLMAQEEIEELEELVDTRQKKGKNGKP